jgi:WD40 repeat protein
MIGVKGQQIDENINPNNKENVVPKKTSKPVVINDKEISSDPIKRTITKAKELGDVSMDFLCCRFDPEDSMLAAGTSDGFAYVYSLKDDKLLHTLECADQPGIPTTCLRWKPAGGKTKNVLVAGNADGTITHWHISSGKQLHKIVEADNQVLCLDYNADGSLFASAGKDYKVRIYDENTKSVITELASGLLQFPGHSNRVFSLKFAQDNPNTLLSAGWDCTIQIWDIREGKSVGSIFGPSVSGDSLDYKNGVILTGSWRNQNQIELWDFASRKLITSIDWNYRAPADNCYVYGAQFSKTNEKTIAAGCSNLNELRLFDRTDANRPFGKLTGLKKGVYSVDFANHGNFVGYCGGEGELGLVSFL